jgi:hypothetical protein
VLYSDDSEAPVEIKKLLLDLKEKDKYRAFDKAAYIPGAMVDDNDEMTGAVGFVILFKGDKLCRIVYGLPTAG